MAKKKGYFAPVLIGILFTFYFFTGGLYFMAAPVAIPLKITAIAGPFCLAAAMIYVSLERIKEIKGGEEDDLGKY